MDRAWRLWASLGVLAALVLGGALGLVVLPIVQGRAAGIDAYTAICRAVGIRPDRRPDRRRRRGRQRNR